jgi:2-polyprenyl-6-methoxyphenol hydroxylase-like FAD-dependent oxidoreductase
MNEKSIVIVGAGMAGLSSGCYSRMNGYKATILEMNSIPGGLSAVWPREGYYLRARSLGRRPTRGAGPAFLPLGRGSILSFAFAGFDRSSPHPVRICERNPSLI